MCRHFLFWKTWITSEHPGFSDTNSRVFVEGRHRPGSTPFLISNTLLRAIGAVINTTTNTMHATQIKKEVPLHLTEKGLYLLDLNELANSEDISKTAEAETLATEESKHAEDRSSPIVAEENRIGKQQNKDCHHQETCQVGKTEEKSEASSTWSFTAITKQPQHDQNPSGSSVFARSFVVPHRSYHVQSCPKIEGSASSSGADCAGLNQFNMEDLEAYAISFGTAQKGDIQHVWNTDQNWVHWFTSHYSNSKKTAHRFFIKFVETKERERN